MKVRAPIHLQLQDQATNYDCGPSSLLCGGRSGEAPRGCGNNAAGSRRLDGVFEWLGLGMYDYFRPRGPVGRL